MNYNIIQRYKNKMTRPIKNPLKQLSPFNQLKYKQLAIQPNFNKGQFDYRQQNERATQYNRESGKKQDILKLFQNERYLYGFQKKQQNFNQRKRQILSLISKQITQFQLQEIFDDIISWKDLNQKYLFQQIVELIQKLLGYQQKNFISQALDLMLKKQFVKTQAKVYISSKSLKICLIIIKLINKKIATKFTVPFLDPFKLLNKFNKNILSYLKSKYPRNKNLFISHELQCKFEQVNFLSILENNVIKNSGFCFTTYNYKRSQTLGKIKQFLNLLMDQINDNFDYFSNILKNQVFLISDLNMKFNKIKIGRKISENVERYYDFDSQNLDITSPQIFRVLIKWIQPLVQLFKNPAEQINARSQIKYFKQIHENAIQYFSIRSKRYQEIKTNLIQKILDNKGRFQEKFSKLIDYLDNFNNNLVKLLMSRKSNFRFLPQDEVLVLKFSKYNTQFLEWIVVEKLLILIQQLSHLTEYFQTKYLKKIDFINFNVYDLLRASFAGTKSQIFEVFQNLKTLQSNNKITILRIKNRINTTLNDVLINFKIQTSILICQLQLILVQAGQETQQKLKTIEDLNHIIYELQRSPYGSISEMALTIGYSDPTIQYEQKIKFQPDWILENNCLKDEQHQFQDIKLQDIPFVCSWCLKYYARRENFFQIHKCKKCFFNKCKSCVFKEDKQQQKKVIFRYLSSCLLNIPLQRIGQKQDEDYLQTLFSFGKGPLGFLMENYIRVRDQIQISKQAKLKKLQKILYKKQQQYGMKGEEPFYCLLLHFSKGQCSIIVLKYVNFSISIAYDLQKLSKRLILQQFDVIFLFPPRLYKSLRTPHIVHEVFNSKQLFLNIRNGKRIEVNKLKYEVTYISYFKRRILLQIDEQNAQEMTITKKQQKFQQANLKIKEIVQKCQNFSMAKKDINVSKFGINQQSLHLIIKSSWKKIIKVLNIEKNKILSVKIIIQQLDQLQQLSAGFNLIQQIRIQKKINLQVLNLEHNYLTKIQNNLNLLSKLQSLNLSNNKIEQIQYLKLKYLQELNLKKNKIADLTNLINSQFQSIQILQLSENVQSQKSSLQIQNLKFLCLKKFEFSNIKISEMFKFDLSSLKFLEYIDASFNNINELKPLLHSELKQVFFNNCKIKDIQNTFTERLVNLTLISLQNNQISSLPILKLEAIQILRLTHNNISDISNLSHSYLPKLIQLDLSLNQIRSIQALSKIEFLELKQLILMGNKIQQVPVLKFPKLIRLILMRNNILSCEKLANSYLPSLRLLNLKENKIKHLPKLTFKNLRQFFPQNNEINSIDEFCNSQISSLKILSMWNNKITDLPILNLNQVQSIFFYSNNLVDVQNLEKSNLSKLKKLNLIKNHIVKLPLLKMQLLQMCYIYNNQIQDINVIEIWETPQLKYLQLSHNKIKQVPSFNFSKLNELYFQDNMIVNISKFSQGRLPSLKKVSFQNNKIKQLTKLLNCPKLKQISFEQNQIQSIIQFSQSDLNKLQKLNLGQNKISDFSQLAFPILQQLLIKKNRIASNYNSRLISHNLKKINLSNNKLIQFPTKLIQGCEIQELFLSKNWFQQIQINIQHKIKRLYLVNCGVTDKSVQNINLITLEQLNLKNNILQKMQFLNKRGTFQRLRKVVLDNNRISILTKISLSKLEQLHLSNNPIKNFDQFLQSKLPLLRLIGIQSLKNQSKQLISQMWDSIQLEENMDSFSENTSEIINQPSIYEEGLKMFKQGSLQIKSQQNSDLIQKIKMIFPKITLKI